MMHYKAMRAAQRGQAFQPSPASPAASGWAKSGPRLAAVSAVLRWFGRGERFLIGALSVAVVLIAWQLSAKAGWVNETFTSAPSDIWRAGIDYVTSSQGVHDLKTSGVEFLVGYLLSAAIGIPLGVLIGWYPRLSAAANPLIAFLYATPTIALAPLFVIWFGIGLESKVAVVVLHCALPIILTTVGGVHATEDALLEMASSFGASAPTVFRRVVIPGSVSAMISGLRIATAMGLIGVIVAELIGSTAGVGYMIIAAGSTFNITDVFVGVFIVGITSIIMNALLYLLERRFSRWKADVR